MDHITVSHLTIKSILFVLKKVDSERSETIRSMVLTANNKL
jgi:hypothetical protein